MQEHARRGGEASKWYVVEPGEVLGYDLNNGAIRQKLDMFEPALRICEECSREYPTQQFTKWIGEEKDEMPLTVEHVRQQLQQWSGQSQWRNVPLCVPTNYYVSPNTAQLVPDYDRVYGLYRFIRKDGVLFRRTKVTRVQKFFLTRKN